MLHLKDVVLRVAGRVLLDHASLHIAVGQKVGLVGRNGTGKTSLLRLIAGDTQADAGEIRLRGGARVGTVAQDTPSGAVTPVEVVLAADRERHALLREAETAVRPERIAEIEMRLVEIRAQAAPARAARILRGLGFDEAAQQRPLDSFSGGWRMRVALAAVLFSEPDLLLLDEPTNHLDLEASMWLEQHLKRYPRTLIIISHDRDLLNSVPDRIVHIEALGLHAYGGGYDTFERTRRERLATEGKERERQEAARKHIQSFVDRFRYKASKARQAQSRLKMLERLQPTTQAIIEPDVYFDLGGNLALSTPLVVVDRIDVGYGGKPVLQRLELRLDPEDRVALLGANGNGKSTLAKLIAGQLEPMTGTVTRARALRVGFFAQHQIDMLEAERTPIEHLASRLPQEREERIRGRLGRFGLVQQRAETPAGKLSGGERTRLCFALMCLEEPQILILDEPSNHLDIDSRQALIEAVNRFPGAVLLVSHDRSFVELTADTLWLVKDGGVRVYDGDLEQYRAELLAEARDKPQQAGRGKETSRIGAAERRSQLAPLRTRARKAEAALERLQKARRQIEQQLADPETYARSTDIANLQKQIVDLDGRIDDAEALWLEAEAAIEEIDRN